MSQILKLQNISSIEEEYGIHQIVLWPFTLFSIQMELFESKLNLFEFTALKLSRAGLLLEDRNIRLISEMLGLEEDLMFFIRSKLIENKYILESQNYQLSEEANEILQSSDQERLTTIGIKNICILRDNISGKYLPLVLDPKLVEFEFLNEFKDTPEGRYAILKTGSAGKAQISQHRVFKYHKDRDKRDPVFENVSRVIKSFKRQWQFYKPLLNLDLEASYPILELNHSFLTDGHKIWVLKKEEILIKTKLVIPKDSDKIQILNPFGFFRYYEHTASLNKAIEADEKLAAWFKALKNIDLNSLSIEKIKDFFEEKQKIKGFSEAVFSYPQIYQKLKVIEAELPKLEHAHESKISAMKRIIISLYDLLEWTFLFCYLDYHANTRRIQSFLELPAQQKNQELETLAQAFGINVHDSNLKLMLKMRKISLSSDLRKGLDLPTITCLLLICTKFYTYHPFRWLLEKQKDFFEKAAILKVLRDEAVHGKKIDEMGDLRALISFFFTSIKIVMPKLIDRSDQNEVKKTLVDDSSLLILAASHERDIYFGDSLIKSKYSEYISEELLRAYLALKNMSSDPVNKNLFDISYFVSCIYTCFQILLIELIHEHKSIKQISTHFIEEAEKNAIAYQFTLNESGILPNALTTVRVNFITDALKGNSSTLGAHILTMLLILDPKKQYQIARSCKGLLIDLAYLIEIRAHGNQSIWQTQEELNIFKHKYFHLLKSLLDE